jgi:hypothetical protein
MLRSSESTWMTTFPVRTSMLGASDDPLAPTIPRPEVA